MKHSDFKRMADATSPANLQGYLFTKEATLISIQFGMRGAWEQLKPEAHKSLNQLCVSCLTFFDSLFPKTYNIEWKDRTIQYIEDDNHVRVTFMKMVIIPHY